MFFIETFWFCPVFLKSYKSTFIILVVYLFYQSLELRVVYAFVGYTRALYGQR